MGEIYFTSDLHINHDKGFIFAARGYKTIEEMNIELITNIQKTITEEDDLYILGDIVLGKIDKAAQWLELIPGHVHYLIGNHDNSKRINLYDELGWESHGYADIVKVGKWNFYISHYPTMVANFDDNEKRIPIINLFGHTHQKDKFYDDNPYMFHVGVDSNNNQPISIEEIKEQIRKKREEIKW